MTTRNRPDWGSGWLGSNRRPSAERSAPPSCATPAGQFARAPGGTHLRGRRKAEPIRGTSVSSVASGWDANWNRSPRRPAEPGRDASEGRVVQLPEVRLSHGGGGAADLLGSIWQSAARAVEPEPAATVSVTGQQAQPSRGGWSSTGAKERIRPAASERAPPGGPGDLCERCRVGGASRGPRSTRCRGPRPRAGAVPSQMSSRSWRGDALARRPGRSGCADRSDDRCSRHRYRSGLVRQRETGHWHPYTDTLGRSSSGLSVSRRGLWARALAMELLVLTTRSGAKASSDLTLRHQPDGCASGACPRCATPAAALCGAGGQGRRTGAGRTSSAWRPSRTRRLPRPARPRSRGPGGLVIASHYGAMPVPCPVRG